MVHASMPVRAALAAAALAAAALLGIRFAQGQAAPAPDPRVQREALVREVASRGISDPRVLQALRQVPRHEFVPAAWRARAYEDRALPIEEGQTISQPYVVALMTELARLQPGARVLEIGTGSGYQAAVLAALGAQVWSIEIVEPLARSSAERLRRLGYGGVRVRAGDGYQGWPEEAPFDAILLTAAPPAIPAPLLAQLAQGGRLVAPVGEREQDLVLVTRTPNGFTRRSVAPVLFVPMTGEAQRPDAGR